MSEADAGVTGNELNFSATQCSSLYGGSSTVQPAGMYGLLLIRASMQFTLRRLKYRSARWDVWSSFNTSV